MASLNTVLSYAFRPFFLLNGLFAIVVVALWVSALHGHLIAWMPANVMMWHGHEMAFGFVLAAVAGFSLTAVATWTGRPAVSGAALGLLLMCWLAGRLAMALHHLIPGPLVAFVDLVFPALLCVFLGREVIGGRSRRNYGIVLILSIMFALNVAYHLGAGNLPSGLDGSGADRLALYGFIHLALLLVTVIAGRIVPNFTANWLRARGETRLPASSQWVDRMTFILTVLVGLAASIAPVGAATGVIALFTALLHGIRLARWRGMATTAEPLLFVLHVAYLWLPLGYLLTACAAFGWMIPPTAAVHALTVGAIGSAILAVTTRVPLGHTGRPLHASRLTTAAYFIFMFAALVRVIGPLSGNHYLSMIDVSAAGWIASFAMFTWVYAPILIGPRVD